jgi:hypothetical protein
MGFRSILFIGIILAAILIAYFSRVTELNFCGKKFPVPSGCRAYSATQLTCDDYQMEWWYVKATTLNDVAEQLIQQLERKKHRVKAKTTCYLMNHKATGYRLRPRHSAGGEYTLVTYGIINRQPVIVNLTLNREPRSTSDLPRFVRQIIQFAD